MPTSNNTISPSDPFVIIAGIRQFGLAPDGSDLRSLEAAIVRAIRAAVEAERRRASEIARGFVSSDKDWDTSYWNQCAERIADAIDDPRQEDRQ